MWSWYRRSARDGQSGSTCSRARERRLTKRAPGANRWRSEARSSTKVDASSSPRAGTAGHGSSWATLAAALGTPSVVLFTPDKLAWQSWESRAHTLIVSTVSLEHADLDRVVATMRGLVG